MRKFCALALTVLLAVSAAGCGTMDPDEAQESIQVIAMDTAMIFTAYGVNSTKADYAAEEEVYRLEAMLSRTDEESPVAQLNSQGTAEVDGELWALMETAMEYTAATGGAFDITVAPVTVAWGFTTDSFQVPTQAELDSLLPLVGTDHIHNLGGNGDGTVTVELDPGTQIDLGGIGKGYASDRVAAIFREYEIPRGLVQLGGSVLAIGDRPDGAAWVVGIKDPRDPDNANAFAAVLNLTDAYAVTSGSYQRYFEQDGETYHHIIDPATGYPADSGLTSVTVVADSADGNGTMCDALSTALFVMGEEKALDFWRSGQYDFQLVLVTEDGRVVVTEGLTDVLTEIDDNGYAYEIVS
jgi:thiamine biosynthesis lipoprotein